VKPDESLEFGHKTLVIRLCQLAADVNDENLPRFSSLSCMGILDSLTGFIAYAAFHWIFGSAE